jgi:hypothetical protein
MTPLRMLALVAVFAACSRDDRSRDVADSLPSDTSAAREPRPARMTADTDSITPAPSDSTALPGSQITVERAVINGVLWGASEDEARKTLGAPRSVTGPVWEEALGDSATVLEYPGFSVRIVERRVVGLHCTASTCITSDAVRVGATRAEVEQVYGKGKVEKGGSNGQLAFPFTTDESCALRFELRQGKVSAMDASCLMN